MRSVSGRRSPRSSIYRGESLPGHLPQVTVAGGALYYDLGGPPAMFQGGDRVAEVRPGQLLPANGRSAHPGGAREEPGGRGVWMANQLCDLVQVRTFEDGSTVRIHMARG